MAANSGTLYITYIEAYGDFLKVWGQAERNLPEMIEKSLNQMTPQFHQGHFFPAIENIQLGMLCCAKYKDGAYYRARILNTSILPQGVVEVHFIDYGNRDVVPINSLRIFSTVAPALLTVLPQAKDFILANVVHPSSTWCSTTLTLISNEIRYTELTWAAVAQVGTLPLIKLYKNGDDIALSLFNRGIVLSIASTAQLAMLQSSANVLYEPPGLTSVNSVPQPLVTPPLTPTILAFKAFTIEPGSENDVYISYVTDGPCQFSIQLKKYENSLANLMNELNHMNLQPLEEDPIPGTACVARCLEDDHICRAVVTSLVDGHYKVFYVDFGNTEIVPIDNLYQIPFKYVIPKVMAVRYALAGLERMTVTLEMKCAFKDFVSDKLLQMRSLPPPNRSGLPLCILWDENKINALDILKRAALMAYPEIIQLTRGFSQEVHVSYVHSCSHFYVQIRSKEQDLCKVMEELQVNCPNASSVQPSQVKVGLPCCTLFDGQWYRAQVLSKDGDAIKVRYVDYGNEEVVSAQDLKIPSGELLTGLRPQALECCLNGYQNMEDDLERDNILEELILEKEFTMKVIEMQGNRALVDLFDSARYNVGSLLLEKLASAKSQVSPLLIQDGHQIELRKRRSPRESTYETSQTHTSERKPLRDQNIREHNNTQDSWRQSKPQFRKETNNVDAREGYNKGKRDGFKKDNWVGKSNDREGNWKRTQRSPNQRESSEKSWSDSSERNWRRNPRANNFNSNDDRKPKRKIDFSNKESSYSSFDNNTPTAKVLDPAPISAMFSFPQLVNRNEAVVISWFHDPAHFFCQLQKSQVEFREMMQEIQSTYSNIQPEQSYIDAPVVALFPEDNVMYRARILETKGVEYRVQYVDFGNVSITDKVWPIDNKFMILPVQAICCGLNLSPMKENWENADTYSCYFDNESFACNFISNDNNNYLIDLTNEGKSVSESLVSDGLGNYKETASVQPDIIDYNILLGQQITVMLGDVQSLDMFNVHFHNGLSILCAMHNLSSATQTYQGALQEIVGKPVIIYIDNVLEHKLEVTLYDSSTGDKVKIIEPDEGAYDVVEIPCPFPIFYSNITGWITHFSPNDENKFTIFMQPSEYADAVAQLLENLYNHYDGSVVEDSICPEVGSLYAVHSSDSNWYRGQISSVVNETVTVVFLDYGNSETVSISELRSLAPEFVTQHILAIRLITTNTNETFTEQEVTANVWYGDNGWEADVQLISQTNIQEQVKALPSEAVLEKFNEGPSQEVCKSSVNEQPIDQPSDDLNQCIGVPVIISHVDSPNEFYLQLSAALEAIKNLQDILQEQISTFPVLENPVAGILCAAPYSVDQTWYRAQVLDADSDITMVRFVDYGNTDVITNSTTEVKTLPSDLLALEQHARRCSLIVKCTDTEWNHTASDRFEQLVNSDHLSAEIIHQDEKTTYIELYANGKNVAEILQQEGLAVKMELETESSCTGYVSNLNSPSEFWIQLENSVADLEWIAEQLSTAETFPELEDLTPGSLCAALFPEDEMWYRARILSNTIAGLEVLFIDYGNSCTCTGLRQLPEDLIMLPALAQKCSLQKPPGILQWSAEATEQFKNISADGATVFNINKITTGETSIVTLLLNGEDIVRDLLPVTEDVRISHFESLSSFWLQKVTDDPKLGEVIQQLASVSEWPKYDQKDETELIAAFCIEDKNWYRGHILSEKNSSYEVQFIDYGSAALVNEVKRFPDEIEQQPPLAIKSKLEPVPGYRWSDDSSKKLQDISDNGNTVFQAELIGGDSVRLYLNGIDIRSDLDSVCVSSAQNSPKKNVVCRAENNTAKSVADLVDSFSKSLEPDESVVHVTVETVSGERMSENIALPEHSCDKESVLEEEIKDSLNISKDLKLSTTETTQNELEDSSVRIDTTKISSVDDVTVETQKECEKSHKLNSSVNSENDILSSENEYKTINFEAAEAFSSIINTEKSESGDLEKNEQPFVEGTTDEVSEGTNSENDNIGNSFEGIEHRLSSRSEKIVPGTVSRGVISEPNMGENQDQIVTDTTELHNESEKYELTKDKKKSSYEDELKTVPLVAPEKEIISKTEEQNTRTTYKRIEGDDGIVPGTVSRGETPEQSFIKDCSEENVVSDDEKDKSKS